MMRLIQTWEEWGTVFAELDFWRDEIRAICEADGVESRLIEPTFPGTHAVFFVNEDSVLKIFCPVRYNSSELELRLHNGPLAHNRLFPQVRFHGRSPSGYDYIAFTRLHGTPVREIDGGAMPEAAVRDLARAIATLQAQTLERDESGSPRCLIHCDLTEDHVFLDSEGRLEGIIDFGDAKMGRPSDEFPALFAACLSCDDSRIAVFREVYDAEAGHYRIDDGDLVDALRRHEFSSDIIAHIRGFDTRFAKAVLDRVSRV